MHSATLVVGGLLIGGVLIVTLVPWKFALGGALVFAVLIGTLLEPGIGLIMTLLMGPWAAWLNTYYAGLLPIDAGQILFLFTLLAWLLGGLARREFRVPYTPLLIPLLVFIGWAALTLLWMSDLKFGLTEVIKWIEIVLAMWLAIDLVRRRGSQWIVIAVVLTLVVQAVIGIYEVHWRGVGPLGFRLAEGIYRAYGTFEQPNSFAGFIGLGLPIMLALTGYYGMSLLRQTSVPKRLHDFARWIACGTMTLLLGAALYLSFSRGAWLGIVAAIGLMLACVPRRWWIGLGLTAFACAVLIGLAAANLLPTAINARLADAGELFQFHNVRGADVTAANYALIDRQARWQAALNMLADLARPCA